VLTPASAAALQSSLHRSASRQDAHAGVSELSPSTAAVHSEMHSEIPGAAFAAWQPGAPGFASAAAQGLPRTMLPDPPDPDGAHPAMLPDPPDPDGVYPASVAARDDGFHPAAAPSIRGAPATPTRYQGAAAGTDLDASPPLTPLGYTPCRTQLDDATLAYLMKKWGGRMMSLGREDSGVSQTNSDAASPLAGQVRELRGRGNGCISGRDDGCISAAQSPYSQKAHSRHSPNASEAAVAQASGGQRAGSSSGKAGRNCSGSASRMSGAADGRLHAGAEISREAGHGSRRAWSEGQGNSAAVVGQREACASGPSSPADRALGCECTPPPGIKPYIPAAPPSSRSHQRSREERRHLSFVGGDAGDASLVLEESTMAPSTASKCGFRSTGSGDKSLPSAGAVSRRSSLSSRREQRTLLGESAMVSSPYARGNSLDFREHGEDDEDDEDDEDEDYGRAEEEDDELRQDVYECTDEDTNMSTECPSIRESLMAPSNAASTLQTSTTSTASPSFENRTLFADSPCSPQQLSRWHQSQGLGHDMMSGSGAASRRSRSSLGAAKAHDLSGEARQSAAQPRSGARGSSRREPSAPRAQAKLISVDAQELSFMPLGAQARAPADQVLLVRNVASSPVALWYGCLDEEPLVGKVSSTKFDVHGSVLDGAPVLYPGQASTLTVSYRVAAGASADGQDRRREDSERGEEGGLGESVLAVVAMAVSEMMKQDAMPEAHCEHVQLRLVPACAHASPAASPANSAHHISKLLDACTPSRGAQGSGCAAVASRESALCGSDTPMAAGRATDLFVSRERKDCSVGIRERLAVESASGDSWFVDCSAMDLGDVYVQDAGKHVIAAAGAERGDVRGLLRIINPTSRDLHFEARADTEQLHARSPLFVVGLAEEGAEACRCAQVTVPARHSQQVQVLLDISAYDHSGLMHCTGELKITRLDKPRASSEGAAASGAPGSWGSCNGGADKTTCVTLTCAVGFCRLQIPGKLEIVRMACASGGKVKHAVALRNGGCLPATVRLAVEDEEDALGRPLALVRGGLDDSVDMGGGRGGGGGDGQGVFRLKQDTLHLAPHQVAKLGVTFAPPADILGLGEAGRQPSRPASLAYKSTLVLRVAQDPGVHYSVMWSQGWLRRVEKLMRLQGMCSV